MKRHLKDGNPQTFTAKLNDKLQGDVVGVDEEAGKIWLYAHDRDGKRIPNSAEPTGYEVVECQGKVEIINGPDVPSQGCFDYMNPETFCCGFLYHPAAQAYFLLSQERANNIEKEKLDFPTNTFWKIRFSRKELPIISRGFDEGAKFITRELIDELCLDGHLEVKLL